MRPPEKQLDIYNGKQYTNSGCHFRCTQIATGIFFYKWQGAVQSKPEPEAKKSWIGESKAQQDQLRKGSEIPPKPPKTDSGKKDSK